MWGKREGSEENAPFVEKVKNEVEKMYSCSPPSDTSVTNYALVAACGS